MIRGFLIAIVMLGVFTSMVGGLVSRSPQAGGQSPVRIVGERADADVGDEERSYSSSLAKDGAIRLERYPNGHFYADVEINGASIRALVDTGASGIALSRDDARTAGVATSIGMPNVVGAGADGDVHGEFVTLDTIALGGKSVEGMTAIVLNAGEQSLLGQSFLSKFDSVEIRGDTMVLR